MGRMSDLDIVRQEHGLDESTPVQVLAILEALGYACDRCGAPVRAYEDFCGEACWEEWHVINDPDTLEELNGHA